MAAGISTDTQNFTPAVAASSSIVSPSASTPIDGNPYADLCARVDKAYADVAKGKALCAAVANPQNTSKSDVVEDLEKARQIIKNASDQFIALALHFEKEENVANKKCAESVAKSLQSYQNPNQAPGTEQNQNTGPHQPKDAAADMQEREIATYKNDARLYNDLAKAVKERKECYLLNAEDCSRAALQVYALITKLRANKDAH